MSRSYSPEEAKKIIDDLLFAIEESKVFLGTYRSRPENVVMQQWHLR